MDPALALFAVGSVYALQRWRTGGEGRWLVVGSACAGAAASTKYLGLFFVALVGLAALSALRKRASRGYGAITLLILLIFVGTCHGRLAVLTGNPVHPYFQRLFGQSPWTVPEADRAGARIVRSGVRGLFKNVVDVVRLPWDLILERQRSKFEIVVGFVCSDPKPIELAIPFPGDRPIAAPDFYGVDLALFLQA